MLGGNSTHPESSAPNKEQAIAGNVNIDRKIPGFSGPNADDTNNNPEGTPPKVQDNNAPETEHHDHDTAAIEQPAEVAIAMIQLTEKDILHGKNTLIGVGHVFSAGLELITPCIQLADNAFSRETLI